MGGPTRSSGHSGPAPAAGPGAGPTWHVDIGGDQVRRRRPAAGRPEAAVFFNHPDHAKHVLADNHANYAKGIGLVHARRALGDGLLTSDGELTGFHGVGESFAAVPDQAMFELETLSAVPTWIPLRSAAAIPARPSASAGAVLPCDLRLEGLPGRAVVPEPMLSCGCVPACR